MLVGMATGRWRGGGRGIMLVGMATGRGRGTINARSQSGKEDEVAWAGGWRGKRHIERAVPKVDCGMRADVEQT